MDTAHKPQQKSRVADAATSPSEAESLDVLRTAVRDNLIRYGAEFHPEFIVSARGSYIYDENGRAIIDFTSGQMCATLGHNHPAIVAAIEKSCREVLHLFSGMLSPAVASLARRMAALLPPSLSKLIFLNTGGESNETALRLAKKFTGALRSRGPRRLVARHHRRRQRDDLRERAARLRSAGPGHVCNPGAQQLSLPGAALS